MTDTAAARMRPWVRFAVAGVAVLAATAVVLLLHGRVSNRADDYAWAVRVAHDKWWWSMLANAVSDATPSVGGPVALLALAAVLGMRSRRWTPLVVAGVAVVLLGAVVAGGKSLVFQGGVATDYPGYRIAGPRWPSGPATTAVVVGGVAALLLRGRVRWVRGFVVFAALVVLLNGIAEVFLGQHRLGDVVASWAAGLAIVTVVGLGAGPRLRLLPDGRCRSTELLRRSAPRTAAPGPVRRSARRRWPRSPGATPGSPGRT